MERADKKFSLKELEQYRRVTRVSYKLALELEDFFLEERDRIPDATYEIYKGRCKKNGTTPIALPKMEIYCETPECKWYCINTSNGDLESKEFTNQLDAVGWLEWGDEAQSVPSVG